MVPESLSEVDYLQTLDNSIAEDPVDFMDKHVGSKTFTCQHRQLALSSTEANDTHIRAAYFS